jgi:hypothetical protein
MTERATGFEVRQEEDAIAARSIARAGVVGVVVAAFAVAAAAALLVAVDGRLRPTTAGPGGPLPSRRTISGIEQTPILDTRVGLDLRAQQTDELRRWGWADRDAGLATIPIERAIDVVVSAEAP